MIFDIGGFDRCREKARGGAAGCVDAAGLVHVGCAAAIAVVVGHGFLMHAAAEADFLCVPLQNRLAGRLTARFSVRAFT